MTVLDPGTPINPPGRAGSNRITNSFVLMPLGEAVPTGERAQPWCILDAHGERVAAFDGFLQHIWARGSENSVRTMAFVLLRWYRLLAAFGLTPEAATRAEVRDLVLYLQQAPNPQRERGPKSTALAPGMANPRTGKRAPGKGYAKSTINHSLSVLSSFYAWRVEEGLSLVNPVPRGRSRRELLGDGPSRPRARQNPAAALAPVARSPYRQRVPKPKPRKVAEPHQQELFEGTLHRRDWAMLFCLVWTGVRAAELLSLTPDRCDRDRLRIWVQGKGLGGELREVPVPAAFFEFLDAYLADLAERGVVLRADEPLWWSVVGEPRPLSYQGLRSWFRRSNERYGLNYTVHDLRHTALRRMVNDTANFTLVEVAEIAGHASVETTKIYTEADLDELVAKVQQHHARPLPPALAPHERPDYDPESISVLFGGRA